jgi:hypothetical protein
MPMYGVHLPASCPPLFVLGSAINRQTCQPQTYEPARYGQGWRTPVDGEDTALILRRCAPSSRMHNFTRMMLGSTHMVWPQVATYPEEEVTYVGEHVQCTAGPHGPISSSGRH